METTDYRELLKIAELRIWKHEAMIVLRGWDDVWDAAGRPGRVGESRSAATAAKVRAMHRELDHLRAALRAEADR